jgi:hypothetical protein
MRDPEDRIIHSTDLCGKREKMMDKTIADHFPQAIRLPLCPTRRRIPSGRVWKQQSDNAHCQYRKQIARSLKEGQPLQRCFISLAG